jgi:hypothetical protein
MTPFIRSQSTVWLLHKYHATTFRKYSANPIRYNLLAQLFLVVANAWNHCAFTPITIDLEVGSVDLSLPGCAARI